MRIEWSVVPEQFHYLRNRVVGDPQSSLGVAVYDERVGRHILPTERLSEKQRNELALVYDEICRREDNFAILDWLDEASTGTKAERDAVWALRSLLAAFAELAALGIDPFSRHPILSGRPEPPLDWSTLPCDLMYVAAAVERYALQSELEIVEWLNSDAGEADFVAISQLDQRMSTDGEVIGAWMKANNGSREVYRVSLLYLILDQAEAMRRDPDRNDAGEGDNE